MTFNSDARKQTLKKIRRLKKDEKLMYESFGLFSVTPDKVWSRFFDMHDDRKGEFPMKLIDVADLETWRLIVDKFVDAVIEEIVNYFGEQHREKSLFELLDLPLNASASEVKLRFRQHAKAFHPDLGGSHEKMQTLNNAYEKYKKEQSRES